MSIPAFANYWNVFPVVFRRPLRTKFEALVKLPPSCWWSHIRPAVQPCIWYTIKWQRFLYTNFTNLFACLYKCYPVSTNVQLGDRGCVHVDEIPVQRSCCPLICQYVSPVTSAVCRLRPRQFAVRSQQVESCLCRYKVVYQLVLLYKSILRFLLQSS